MIDSIKSWFVALSRREQFLVGFAGGLATIIFAVWIAFALSKAIDTKQAEHFKAMEMRARIEAKALALSKAAKALPIAVQQGPLELAVSQSATEKGFTLDKTEARGADQVAIVIAQARPAALLGWLSELEGQSVVADEVSIKPGTNGTVAVTITLKRQSQ